MEKILVSVIQKPKNWERRKWYIVLYWSFDHHSIYLAKLRNKNVLHDCQIKYQLILLESHYCYEIPFVSSFNMLAYCGYLLLCLTLLFNHPRIRNHMTSSEDSSLKQMIFCRRYTSADYILDDLDSAFQREVWLVIRSSR